MCRERNPDVSAPGMRLEQTMGYLVQAFAYTFHDTGYYDVWRAVGDAATGIEALIPGAAKTRGPSDLVRYFGRMLRGVNRAERVIQEYDRTITVSGVQAELAVRIVQAIATAVATAGLSSAASGAGLAGWQNVGYKMFVAVSTGTATVAGENLGQAAAGQDSYLDLASGDTSYAVQSWQDDVVGLVIGAASAGMGASLDNYLKGSVKLGGDLAQVAKANTGWAKWVAVMGEAERKKLFSSLVTVFSGGSGLALQYHADLQGLAAEEEQELLAAATKEERGAIRAKYKDMREDRAETHMVGGIMMMLYVCGVPEWVAHKKSAIQALSSLRVDPDRYTPPRLTAEQNRLLFESWIQAASEEPPEEEFKEVMALARARLEALMSDDDSVVERGVFPTAVGEEEEGERRGVAVAPPPRASSRTSKARAARRRAKRRATRR